MKNTSNNKKATPRTITQREIRQGVDVGRGMFQVTSVSDWYKNNHFDSDEAAKGAFDLAYQQALDGMGKSIREWMGLSEDEFSAWYGNGILPQKRNRN